MDRFLSLLSMFLLAAVSNAALSPQLVYWHSVLPNTPMPSAISDFIDPDVLAEEKSGVNVYTKGKSGGATVNVGHGGVNHKGKPRVVVTVPDNILIYRNAATETQIHDDLNGGHGGVHVATGKPGPGTNVNVGHGSVNENTGHKGKPRVVVTVPDNILIYRNAATETQIHDDLNGGHGGVHVATGKPGPGTNVNVGHGSVNENTGHKGKPRVVVTVPNRSININYAATETQIHDDPNVAFFFMEKELRPGAKMNLHFTKTTSGGASFLTQKEADAIPFSSAKIPEILDHFSVKPGSAEAEAMKTTLQECEEPTVRGERKYCATSLESMVEFSMSSLGTRDVTAMSTTVAKVVTPRQQYTVTGVKALAGDRLVVCHPQAYAYAVFYCHATATSKAYRVGMVGKADGVVVEEVAVCHTDTSAWNPNHVAFKVLKVKPGSVPVCDFLTEDGVVWIRSG